MPEYVALNKVIEYRNDFPEQSKTKKVFVYGFDKKYPNFFKVVDYPIEKENLNARWIYNLGDKKGSRRKLKKSGEWHIVKRNILLRERRMLELNLK